MITYDLIPLAIAVFATAFWFGWVKPREEARGREFEELRKRIKDTMRRAEEALENTCAHYVSTACHHANEDDNDEMHKECRLQCKWCPRKCGCACHLPPENFLHELEEPTYETVERMR